jgi:TPR repeat protein
VSGPHLHHRRVSAWPRLFAAALVLLLSAPATASPPAKLLAAAAAGDADAQAELGGLYYRGEGVARDPAAAFDWLRRAAEQGSLAAQRGLVVLYYNGEGTPQHLVEALKWALIAARQGDAEAADHRDYLLDRLAPFQLREAERLAARWQPTPETPPAPKRP